jgi:hypothetical protein
MRTSTIESYSPRIKSTLLVADRRINVRELASDFISVEADEYLPPCAARIETLVGDDCDVIEVELLQGIDPNRQDQPIRIIEPDNI